MTMNFPPDPAVVIGAGIGGLAAAMRLGAKGWRVTVIDRLDVPGGRGSSITQGGHRFDLGPTIVTVPQGLARAVGACGRDFDRDVTCGRWTRSTKSAGPTAVTFTARQDRPTRCGPRWRACRPAI
jgi:phytoene desaturase